MFEWLIVGIALLITAVFPIAVSISAKKIDFGSRVLKDKPIRSQETLGGLKFKAKKSKAKRATPPPPPSSAPYVTTASTEPLSRAIAEEAKMKEEWDEVENEEWDETDIESDVLPEDIESETLPETIASPHYVSPKVSRNEFAKKSFIEPTESLDEETIEILEEQPTLHTRDLSIHLPKNMCLDEVFRLRITLLKSDEFSKDVSIKHLELTKKEAEYFSITAKKLGKEILEATTKIEGLEQGNLKVRPLSTSNVVTIAPTQRTVYFDTEDEEIVVEFYLVPKRWISDPISILRVEFEQNYKIIRTIDLPIRIYKRQFEALFGFNLSKWHKYALLIYGVISTLIGLYSTLAEYIPSIQIF